MSRIVSEAEYEALRTKWKNANELEIKAGRRPLKPIAPSIRVRKEGMFYIGPWLHQLNEEAESAYAAL